MLFRKDPYNPQFFLASLGAGGLVVSFFMYLMFMTKHNPLVNPIPTYNTLFKYFESGLSISSGIFIQILILLSCLGILYFGFLHYKLLFLNLRKYFKFRGTKDFENLKNSNSEVILMTIPLTLAMSLNVSFIIGVIFIPGLWSKIETLFPFALVGFLLVGIYALKIFSEYFVRIIANKSFDFVENNSLSQMLSVFAFAMVGVGFAGPAAMSINKMTVSIAMVGTIFFITIAIFFGIIKIILGFKSMLEYGIKKEASPTIWIVIPFLTILTISFVRQKHGLHTGFGIHSENGSLFVLTTIAISIQLIFAYIGYKVMKMNNYFKDYLHGEKKSVGSYALICPGVALVVSSFFFIHLGFVKTGVIEKFGLVYFLLILPVVFLQLKTIWIMIKLNKKLL
ncbi:hypothetical protein CSB07_00455 [Candidatus Gracilibacteria bacterium]|nr:MAG: hypothetical protein CSB07_00455 [Candidatus Gracilibacteria bacterium]PIE85142.1 MAG: hypothetical protein CSA08_03610 [Candidatus Gracilibacteria bacterium]